MNAVGENRSKTSGAFPAIGLVWAAGADNDAAQNDAEPLLLLPIKALSSGSKFFPKDKAFIKGESLPMKDECASDGRSINAKP